MKSNTYFDKVLASSLDKHKVNVREQDMDGLIVVDGSEASVQHILALQVGKYLSNTVRIVSDDKSFRKAVIAGLKYDCIIYDMTFEDVRKSTDLINVLDDIVQKNMFIILIVPTFFDLPKPISAFKSKFLLHAWTKGNWTKENFESGYFSAYDYKKKQELYTKGKKTYTYSLVKPNFKGRFTNEMDAELEKEMRKQRQKHVDEHKKGIKKAPKYLWDIGKKLRTNEESK